MLSVSFYSSLSNEKKQFLPVQDVDIFDFRWSTNLNYTAVIETTEVAVNLPPKTKLTLM